MHYATNSYHYLPNKKPLSSHGYVQEQIYPTSLLHTAANTVFTIMEYSMQHFRIQPM